MSSTLVGYTPMQGALITDQPGLVVGAPTSASGMCLAATVTSQTSVGGQRIASRVGYCGSHPSTRQTYAAVKLAMTFSALTTHTALTAATPHNIDSGRNQQFTAGTVSCGCCMRRAGGTTYGQPKKQGPYACVSSTKFP
jgi:hypothetical protein